ncbi:BA14K family protein [Mesorhizobium atlanticum]
MIGSAIANDQNRVYAGNAHIQWCYDHYRSYRASDNTFNLTTARAVSAVRPTDG